MSERVVVHDSVYSVIAKLSDESDLTKKEVIRDVFSEAGYNV